MIATINGPSGVGKTETTFELLHRMPHSVMLDMDFIGWNFHSFDYSNQSHLDYSYTTLSVLIKHHVEHGWHNFVVNGVFEWSQKQGQILSVVSPFKLSVKAFVLWCDLTELVSRVEASNRPPNIKEELTHSQELFQTMKPLVKS